MSINIKNEKNINRYQEDISQSESSNCVSSLFNQLSKIIVPFHSFYSNSEKLESTHPKGLDQYKEILKKELMDSY